jgi:hypothetical protein
MRLIKSIILIFLLTGCSAEWHLNQAIKKNPAMAQTSVYGIDTIFVRDSITMTDTFTTTEVDTVILTKDGVTTVVYRNHDVIRVKTIVKADTIRYTKTITLPPQIKFVERKKGFEKYGPYLGILLLILLMISILKNSRRGW